MDFAIYLQGSSLGSDTARFSGISVCNVQPGGSEGVLVTAQKDYWDSINTMEGGDYQKVDKGMVLGDFIDQLKPRWLSSANGHSRIALSIVEERQRIRSATTSKLHGSPNKVRSSQ